MREVEEKFTAGLMKLMAAAVADRAPMWVALLGGVGLWTWAVAHPDVLRIVTAACYSILVYIPMLYKRGG